MVSKTNNTAGAQAAGYILQLERALHHLAHASSIKIAVAIEHFDDVAVMEDEKVLALEQDKSSTKEQKKILADRSRALWRTLQIWLAHDASAAGADTSRYLFFVNQWVESPIAQKLKECGEKSITSSEVVSLLRAIGGKRTQSKIQIIIDDVLSRSDPELEALINKIEIVLAPAGEQETSSLANGLGLDPRADIDDILTSLLGWLTARARADWSAKNPCIVTRSEVLIYCSTSQRKQANSRLLPRASADISLQKADRENALTRNFVEHLSKISADDEDVLVAVDHFLRFNIEKHRLVRTGEVPDNEWGHRSSRLRERWAGIRRVKGRELAGRTNSEIGHAILAEATYQYKEPLDGHPCDELYMTAGNYHRLADDDEVWWDPAFTKGSGDAG
ncbi:hypothetical protein PQU92_02820 [Asticcacaulis sp. BYS171W]|uniref:ABC-three component systems C-terminal domain-containing protein n=1 Tax=Asticcacaulis aquaticus TaxID=2984212 RepID=A0ABT5HRV7_9CAUL|nr:ABC-three component system protein [Asticcacaulis aquaticus]MDC7682191.1 hypothetical protein [Asticcacaulis aquaticus]